MKHGLSNRGYRRCKQGYFKCKNPEKYIGDQNKIIYRSGLELTAFRFMDNNPNIIRWGSEIITVPYFDAGHNKQRTYYVDLYIEFLNKDNKIIKNIIEVKPFIQTRPPSNRGKNYKKRLTEYLTNTSKWKAATTFAELKGMQFQILTEKDLK